MKRVILTTVFLAGFGPFICDDADVETARTQIRKGENALAVETLAEVEADAAEVHLARAVALLRQDKNEEAGESLNQAYRLVAGAEARGEPLPTGDDLRARIAFNRGLLHSEKEEWEAAMAEFAKVLRAFPDDEDARWNLELAWLKANPPCPLREDDHEPDDTRQGAPAFAEEKAKERMLCPTNEDWYSLPAQKGAILYVTLQGEVDTEDGETRAVKLELYAPEDPAGAPSREAEFTDGAARVSYSELPSSGTWAVRVWGTGKAEVKYDLTVQMVPPCPADDRFEGKDTAEAPHPLEDGKEEHGLKACPGNPDWFKVTVPKDEGRKVTVGYDLQRAALTTTVFDAGRQPVLVAKPGPHGSVARLPKGEAPQVFMVQVAAATSEENIYSIKVEPDEGDGNDDQQDPEQDEDEKKDEEQEKEEGDQDKRPPPKPDEVDIDQLIDALDKHQGNPQLQKALRQLKTPPPTMEDY